MRTGSSARCRRPARAAAAGQALFWSASSARTGALATSTRRCPSTTSSSLALGPAEHPKRVFGLVSRAWRAAVPSGPATTADSLMSSSLRPRARRRRVTLARRCRDAASERRVAGFASADRTRARSAPSSCVAHANPPATPNRSTSSNRRQHGTPAAGTAPAPIRSSTPASPPGSHTSLMVADNVVPPHASRGAF